MKRISYVLIAFVSVFAMTLSSVEARGRGGGGGYSRPTFSGQRQFHGQVGTNTQFRGQAGRRGLGAGVRSPGHYNYYRNNHIQPYRRWGSWGYWWGPVTWIGLSSWIAWNWGPPLYYNYGSNFYYADDYVYLNGKRLSSAAEYYDQAVRILDKAPKSTSDEDKWMPIGAFSLTQDTVQPSKPILQLAANKKGVLRGTCFDIENKTANPIRGIVDKTSQRAVWTFADKDKNAVIMETGIFNLTKDQTGVLAHFGKERTQQWTMVRLKEPQVQKNQALPNQVP